MVRGRSAAPTKAASEDNSGEASRSRSTLMSTISLAGRFLWVVRDNHGLAAQSA
jgi:hypothetical protein